MVREKALLVLSSESHGYIGHILWSSYMRRFLFLAVPAAAVALAASLAIAPHAALACSGDPTYNPLKGADAAVYGHFDRIAHDGARPSAPYDPSLLTIGVERTLVGDPLGAFIEAHADVPLPKVPTMCPQFDRENLVGRHAVIALYRGVDGSWSTNRVAVWFVGDTRLPAASDALARLLDPPAARRTLTASVSPQVGICDSTTFIVRGTGWPAVALINVSVNGGFGVMGNSGADGSFELLLRRSVLPCTSGGDVTLSVTAPAVLSLQPVTLRLGVRGAGAPLPPDAGSGTSGHGQQRTAVVGAILLLASALFAAAALTHRRIDAHRSR